MVVSIGIIKVPVARNLSTRKATEIAVVNRDTRLLLRVVEDAPLATLFRYKDASDERSQNWIPSWYLLHVRVSRRKASGLCAPAVVADLSKGRVNFAIFFHLNDLAVDKYSTGPVKLPDLRN